jgi:hypothetical protein
MATFTSGELLEDAAEKPTRQPDFEDITCPAAPGSNTPGGSAGRPDPSPE